MDNDYKKNDVLGDVSKYKKIYLNINGISIKINKYYDRVANKELAYDAYLKLERRNKSDFEKMNALSMEVYNLYMDITTLKTNFIDDCIKNKSDQLMLKGRLESYFKALDPFFIGDRWDESHRIVNKQNEIIHNNPDIINELKIKEKKSIIDIIHLVSKDSFDSETAPLAKKLKEEFKNIEKVIKEVVVVNKDLELLTDDKENPLKNKYVVNSKKEKKERRYNKLESKLEKNKLKLNEQIKKLSPDDYLLFDINKLIEKSREKALYSYNIENINKELSVSYDKINEFIKLSLGGEDDFPLIENNEIINSSDQVKFLKLKKIDERILINIKNIYVINEKSYFYRSNNKLELLYNEFLILHDKKNEIINNRLTLDEKKQDVFSLAEKILAQAHECYNKNIILSSLEEKINTIDEFISTEKRKIFSISEKRKISSMIDQWQGKLINGAITNGVLITDAADLSKVEGLASSINGMTEQASSSVNDPMHTGVSQHLKLVGDLTINNSMTFKH